MNHSHAIALGQEDFDVGRFLPADLIHRDGLLDALSASLDPVVTHGTGRQTHLFGPSGAGKTCLARYCLQQLREEAPHVRWLNCWEHYGTQALLYQLAAGVGQAAELLAVPPLLDGPPFD